MSEYDPGSLALIQNGRRGSEFVALAHRSGGLSWAYVDEDGHLCDVLRADVKVIRLLHILGDSEVGVGAEYVRGAIEQGNLGRNAAVTFRVALDAYDAARTPQIEEPQGLGAVVEGRDGLRWVRTPDTFNGYEWVSDQKRPVRDSWVGLKATRILSEGVRLDEEAGR